MSGFSLQLRIRVVRSKGRHELPRREREGLPQQGVYVLLVRAKGDSTGERKVLRWDLRPGYYAYVGRARRGLPARLARHLRREKEGKRLFWHVDRLLEMASLEEIWIYPLESGECALASALQEMGGDRSGLAGFGSSDCRCSGHLLYFGAKRPLPDDESLPRVFSRRPPPPLRGKEAATAVHGRKKTAPFQVIESAPERGGAWPSGGGTKTDMRP